MQVYSLPTFSVIELRANTSEKGYTAMIEERNDGVDGMQVVHAHKSAKAV